MKSIEVATERLFADETLVPCVSLKEISDSQIEIRMQLPENSQAGTSIATSLNALALRVIGRLSVPTEIDVNCILSEVHMNAIEGEDSKAVLPMLASFVILEKE